MFLHGIWALNDLTPLKFRHRIDNPQNNSIICIFEAGDTFSLGPIMALLSIRPILRGHVFSLPKKNTTTTHQWPAWFKWCRMELHPGKS